MGAISFIAVPFDARELQSFLEFWIFAERLPSLIYVCQFKVKQWRRCLRSQLWVAAFTCAVCTEANYSSQQILMKNSTYFDQFSSPIYVGHLEKFHELSLDKTWWHFSVLSSNYASELHSCVRFHISGRAHSNAHTLDIFASQILRTHSYLTRDTWVWFVWVEPERQP